GFAYILLFLILFHTTIAVITQVFGIFIYGLVLFLNLVLFFIVVKNVSFKKVFDKKNLKRVDWILIFVVLIAFIYLFSVHYNYSGEFSVLSTLDYQKAESMVYSYPYFADEWHTISFVDYSINSRSLPIKNPLIEGFPFFPNFAFSFYSFLSGLFLLLGLNPLMHYTIFSLFSGLLIILLIYLFLVFSGVQKLTAAIASLFSLYITNGANLPGIWNLIPITMGVILILIGFFFISTNDKKMMVLTLVLLFLFYKPLIIFYLFSILIKKITFEGYTKKILFHLTLVFFFVLLVFLISWIFLFFSKFFIGSNFNLGFQSFVGELLKFYSSKTIYSSFTTNFIPQYNLFKVVPFIVIIFSIFGFFLILKKKTWLIGLVSFSLLYWVIYSFSTFRILIDYERIVFFSSILLIILSGFGLDFVLKIIKKTNLVKRNIINYSLVGILVLFFFLSFNYTNQEEWKELVAVNPDTGNIALPAAPANRYLHEDDLKLFENISKQNFLSHPWKGLVIGVATDNFPMSTKPGTLTINQDLFDRFLRLDCDGKRDIALSRNIDYFYLPFNLDCSGFSKLAESSEGFVLYLFQ
ncbi:MAG: hypothetical protein ACE5ES_03360, partial [Candidatus Nanoarchaeia archaeon]